ncbi:MAG: disulfide bond formation protein B [Rubrivivax sp.]|jgi:disulfide bond formation protein DsbB|nr:disulfide bond formation protein B [Rubrivivax sp.]
MTARDLGLAAIAAASLVAVGIALTLQYRWEMQPCPWCILQRLIFVVIAAVALLGLLWRGRFGARVAVLLIVALAGCGIAAALWQHFVAATAETCALTLAERIISTLTLDERWPEIFTAYASCKDAAVNLLGIPFEIWSLTLFVLVTVAAVSAWPRSR